MAVNAPLPRGALPIDEVNPLVTFEARQLNVLSCEWEVGGLVVEA
jgi:hypothetical protein